jgi:hypothetical protein
MLRVPDPVPGGDDETSAGAATPPRSSWSRARQNFAIVLWPSFLTAAVATMFFFAAFDPPALGSTLAEGSALHELLASREAGYAFGFFVFWLLAAASSSLTLYLARTQHPEPPPPVDSWMRDLP